MAKINYLQKIQSKSAPTSAGPYSQAIKVGGFIFCSGQIGLNPRTNNLVRGGVEKEMKQALKNLSQVLKAGGASFKNVVRVDIFLTNINDFNQVNEIYGQYFTNEPRPARQTSVVVALPKKAKIEISCIAYVKK